METYLEALLTIHDACPARWDIDTVVIVTCSLSLSLSPPAGLSLFLHVMRLPVGQLPRSLTACCGLIIAAANGSPAVLARPSCAVV